MSINIAPLPGDSDDDKKPKAVRQHPEGADNVNGPDADTGLWSEETKYPDGSSRVRVFDADGECSGPKLNNTVRWRL